MASTNPNIWVPKQLLQSPALLSLKNPTAIKVLMLFLIRRQCEKIRPGKRGEWIIANNGEIEFTYAEALNKWRISNSTFRRAIHDLLEKGFIDIAAGGQGVHKVKNLYAISNRWKDYGKPEYRPPALRPKGPINRGFQPGNTYGKNSRKKTPTVDDNNNSMPGSEHKAD